MPGGPNCIGITGSVRQVERAGGTFVSGTCFSRFFFHTTFFLPSCTALVRGPSYPVALAPTYEMAGHKGAGR